MENGKVFVKPKEFLEDSVSLGSMILKSGFKPTFVLALWRGGSFPGSVIQEYLKYHSINTDHIAIRTSGRTFNGDIKKEIGVYGTDYLIANIKPESKILIVDDVFDSGLTLQEVIKIIKEKSSFSEDSGGEIKTATLDYKPEKNKTKLEPDFYVHENNNWLVFPGEFENLSKEEIYNFKGAGIGRFFEDDQR